MKKESVLAKTYTGHDIGRRMIEDLISSFARNQGGADAGSILTDDEKSFLVNGLVKPEDIRRYNEFRYIHEYLVHVPTSFALHEQTAGLSSFHLLSMLTNLSVSEAENTIERRIPRIMTQKQFDALSQTGALNAPFGVAIVQDESCVEGIDKNGDYHTSSTFWRRHYLAEQFLKNNNASFRMHVNKYQTAIKKCFAIATTVRLIGEFIDLPAVSILVGDVDMTTIDAVNNLMDRIPNHIERYGLYDDEWPVDSLREQLRKFLKPLDLEALKPAKKAVATARKCLDFSTFQGKIQSFYALLMNGGDPS